MSSCLRTCLHVFLSEKHGLLVKTRRLRGSLLSYNNLLSAVDVDARLGGASGVLAALQVVPVF